MHAVDASFHDILCEFDRESLHAPLATEVNRAVDMTAESWPA